MDGNKPAPLTPTQRSILKQMLSADKPHLPYLFRKPGFGGFVLADYGEEGEAVDTAVVHSLTNAGYVQLLDGMAHTFVATEKGRSALEVEDDADSAPTKNRANDERNMV